MCSYNVLAHAYAKASRYPNVMKAHLYGRTPALCAKVAMLEADILCLQEVEPGVFEALKRTLGDHLGIFAKKKRFKPDGCATFVRRRYPVLEWRAEYYGDGSGHLALLVKCAGFAIANTHLKWGGTPAATLAQATQMHAALDDRKPWIVGGDFNAEIDSAALRLFLDHGFHDAFAAAPAFTCNPNGKAKRIDFILSQLPLVGLPLPVIEDHTPLPCADQPSDHLPLLAALSKR